MQIKCTMHVPLSLKADISLGIIQCSYELIWQKKSGNWSTDKELFQRHAWWHNFFVRFTGCQFCVFFCSEKKNSRFISVVEEKHERTTSSLPLAGSYLFRLHRIKKKSQFRAKSHESKNIPQTGAQVKKSQNLRFVRNQFHFLRVYPQYLRDDLSFFGVNLQHQKSDFRDVISWHQVKRYSLFNDGHWQCHCWP